MRIRSHWPSLWPSLWLAGLLALSAASGMSMAADTAPAVSAPSPGTKVLPILLMLLLEDEPPTVSLTVTPTVTLTAPATITLTATTTAEAGRSISVQYFNGTTLLGAASISPYTLVWSPVAAGHYTISAKATDSAGNSALSAPVQLQVNAPPTVVLTSPAANAIFVAPATIPLAGTASDVDGAVATLQFFQGNTLIGTATGLPFSATWAKVAAGSYSLSARATDNLGATTRSAQVSITVRLPAITLNQPTGQLVAPANIALVASIDAPGLSIAKIEFFNGSTLIGAATSSPYAVTWSKVAAGLYSLTAKMSDSDGNVTTSTAISVSVQPHPQALYAVHVDQDNTPRLVVDTQNQVVWRDLPTATEPFGASDPEQDPRATGSAFSLNLGFHGLLRDASAGLVFDAEGIYEPAIGRCVQAAPALDVAPVPGVVRPGRSPCDH